MQTEREDVQLAVGKVDELYTLRRVRALVRTPSTSGLRSRSGRSTTPATAGVGESRSLGPRSYSTPLLLACQNPDSQTRVTRLLAVVAATSTKTQLKPSLTCSSVHLCYNASVYAVDPTPRPASCSCSCRVSDLVDEAQWVVCTGVSTSAGSVDLPYLTQRLPGVRSPRSKSISNPLPELSQFQYGPTLVYAAFTGTPRTAPLVWFLPL